MYFTDRVHFYCLRRRRHNKKWRYDAMIIQYLRHTSTMLINNTQKEINIISLQTASSFTGNYIIFYLLYK